MMENHLTSDRRHGPMSVRMFTTESTSRMTTRTYAAEANHVADDARMRVFGPCPVSPAVQGWSPISLGTTTAKHGQPRRHEVSHP